MKYLKTIGKVLAAVAEPLRLNCAFAVFMYMLGCITAWATLPDARGAHLYDNLYLELFLDVYVLTLILTAGGHDRTASFYETESQEMARVISCAQEQTFYGQVKSWRIGTLLMACDGTRIQDESGNETPAQ